MELWPSKWYCAIWGILSFLILLGGIESNRVDLMVAGAILLFVATSAYLMYYVESEHRVRRAFELLFATGSGVLLYGYIQTGNFILGIITIFIVAIVFFLSFSRFLNEFSIGVGLIMISLTIMSFTFVLLTYERELIKPLFNVLKISVFLMIIGFIMIFLPKRR